MNERKSASAIFITFSGNCREALTFYQDCFGGSLAFDTLDHKIKGYNKQPVVSASLYSDRINLHGSDLVHDEGRIVGNHVAILLPCANRKERTKLARRLQPASLDYKDENLIEIIDRFDVRWILS